MREWPRFIAMLMLCAWFMYDPEGPGMYALAVFTVVAGVMGTVRWYKDNIAVYDPWDDLVRRIHQQDIERRLKLR